MNPHQIWKSNKPSNARTALKRTLKFEKILLKTLNFKDFDFQTIQIFQSCRVVWID